MRRRCCGVGPRAGLVEPALFGTALEMHDFAGSVQVYRELAERDRPMNSGRAWLPRWHEWTGTRRQSTPMMR